MSHSTRLAACAIIFCWGMGSHGYQKPRVREHAPEADLVMGLSGRFVPKGDERILWPSGVSQGELISTDGMGLVSGNVAFEVRHDGLSGVGQPERVEGHRDSDIWGTAQSGVVSRCVSGAEPATVRRFTIATWVFHGAVVAVALLALAGLLLAPVATPFVLKVLPAFLPFLVAGLAAAERALCRCPVCGGSLLGGFWAYAPCHHNCWLADERASDRPSGELCRAGGDTHSDTLQTSALRE